MSILEDQVNAIIDVVTEEIHTYTDEAPGFIEEMQKSLYDQITKILTPPSLDDYGLIVGQQIKFVPPGGSNKKDGHVCGINPDGSIYIQDHSKNFGRSILPDNIYVNLPGPKGGSSWKRLQGDNDV